MAALRATTHPLGIKIDDVRQKVPFEINFYDEYTLAAFLYKKLKQDFYIKFNYW